MDSFAILSDTTINDYILYFSAFTGIQSQIIVLLSDPTSLVSAPIFVIVEYTFFTTKRAADSPYFFLSPINYFYLPSPTEAALLSVHDHIIKAMSH